MNAFLAAALSFPTVMFTVLLAVFLVYAAATLLGALDLEGFEIAGAGMDEGVLSAGVRTLGLAGVPLGIFGGVASLIAWATSFLAARFLPDHFLIDAAIFIGAGVVGLAGGARAVQPLRRLFDTREAPHRSEIVGKICTIRSLRVDGSSGTAEIADGGAGLIAEVRCFRENEMTLGTQAVIYEYDAEQDVYHVGPLDRGAVRATHPPAVSRPQETTSADIRETIKSD